MKYSIGHFLIGEVFKTKGEDHTGRPQVGKYSATKSNQHPNSQEKIQKKARHCLPMPSVVIKWRTVSVEQFFQQRNMQLLETDPLHNLN